MKKTTGKGKFFSILILLYIFIVLVGFSRVYLGMHTWDQVILGWIFGLYHLVLFNRYIEGHIDKFLKCVKENNKKYRNSKYLLSLSLSYVILIAIPYLAYFYNITYRDIS